VNLQAGTAKHFAEQNASIFRPEDEDSIFPKMMEIYLQVLMASEPR
jgi:hypothetical protein